MNEDAMHHKLPLPVEYNSLRIEDEYEYGEIEGEWVSLWLARLFAGVVPEPIYVRHRMPMFARESLYHDDVLLDLLRHQAEKEAREKNMAIVYYTALREVNCFEYIEYQFEAWAVPIRYE